MSPLYFTELELTTMEEKKRPSCSVKLADIRLLSADPSPLPNSGSD